MSIEELWQREMITCSDGDVLFADDNDYEQAWKAKLTALIEAERIAGAVEELKRLEKLDIWLPLDRQFAGKMQDAIQRRLAELEGEK